MSKGPMSPQFLTVFALLLVGSSANNIQPKQYTLELLIDTEKDVFSGNLIIDAVVLQGGALNFVLHNSGLNISTVNVNQQGIGNTYQSMQTNADSQFTMISVYRGLASDRNVQISIAYEGRVTNDGAGLFSFWDNGKKFYMTNFYPIYARRVFPCIDEPGVAAQMALNIILTKSNGTLIASTGMLQEKTLPNGYKMYALSTTVPIAPYSLFFTVGDWSDDVYYPPSPSKVWLPPSLKGMANNIDTNLIGALRNSKISFFLHAFTQQLNIFIVPHLKDETYTGLNTLVLRNDIVIKNPQETTKTMERDHLVKFAFASWKLFYGTAMRPTDWGNNWLSTSVPMYLAYKILDEPEFTPLYGNSDENLVTGLYEKVFATSLASDSPVTYLAMSPTQPEDIVSFVQSSGVEKGVYSLKTIESVVKPDMLSSALFAFFTQYNNSSVDTALLIDFIGKSTNPVILSKTLSDVMMPILSQTGYPLISLSRNGGIIDMLKQSFAAGSNKPSKSPRLTGANSWELPVTVSTSMNPSRENISVFFFKAGPSNNLVEIGSGYPQNGWALLNLDGKGMMRTSYDLLSWNLFAANANSTNTFSPATRAKLVADAFAAAESQTNHWLNTIKFLEMLDSENHTAPWMNALAGFKRMWSWIYSTGENAGQINLVQPFKTYVMARLSNIYQKLGPIGHNGEANDYLRREIVAAMCEYGSNECINNLTAQYDKMFHKEFEPSNNLFSVVVCNGLRNAKADDWTSALNMFVFSGSWFPQQVLNSHYSFLACSNSDEIINSFLTTILLSTNNVSFPQNQIVPAVSEILDKPQHVTKVVRFFVDNQPKFNFSSETQAEIVTEIGKRVTTSSQTDMLKAFQSKHNVTSDVAAALSKAISHGSEMTALIQKIAPIVQAALASENPTTTSTGPSSSTGTTSSAPTVTTSTVSPPPSTTPGAASATAVSIGALLATLVVAFCAQ